jgi:hypothetical protein
MPPGNTGCQSPTWNKPVPPFGAFEITMTSEDDLKARVWLNPRSQSRTDEVRALRHLLAVAYRRATNRPFVHQTKRRSIKAQVISSDPGPVPNAT